MKKAKKGQLMRLLSAFTLEGIKPGDLVITAEIHRVVKRFGSHKGSWAVVDVHPVCGTCKTRKCFHERIMHEGYGQQGIMKLRTLR